MTWFMLFGLYLLKHVIMAHIVDMGYSKSRIQSPVWVRHVLLCGLCEIVVTSLIFNRYSVGVIGPLLILELVGLIASANYERKSPLTQMLKRHAVAEVGMILLFAFMAYRLSGK